MKPVTPGLVGVALVTAALVTMVPHGLIGSRPESRSAQGPGGISPLVGAPDPRGDLPNYARHVGATVDRFWAGLFRYNNAAYRTPRLLITSRDVGGCGAYSLRMGPFYCSADATIYLPNGYFSALVRGRQVTPGDFAPAYVMAHEWGHHVQALYGLQAMRDRELRRADAAGRQAVSINYELQADCFAGTWARDAFGRGMLEPGDIEEAQSSAVQIGDDNLGLELRHWGHGSSAQRFAAFNHGLASGDPSQCRLLTSETRPVQRDEAVKPRTLKVGSYEVTVPMGSTVARLQNGGYQIHQSGMTAHIGSRGGSAAGPASGQVVAAMRAWNVGAPLSPVGRVRTRQHLTPAGTVAMHAYDQNSGSGGRVHGLFLLHVGTGPTPEGIIVDVFTDGPARGARDWAQLEQMIQSLTGTLVFARPW